MFSTIFQLAGALLLGYMIAFRKKKEIIASSSVVVLVSKSKPKSALDKWIETHGYRIGFFYIIIGYLIPIYENNIKIPALGNMFLIIFSSILLLILGISISNCLGKRSFDKMTHEDFYNNSPEGTIMVEIDDNQIEDKKKENSSF